MDLLSFCHYDRKMKIRTTIAAGLLFVLAGCVTPVATLQPPPTVKLSPPQEIAYKVRIGEGAQLGADSSYISEVVSLLDGLLKVRLQQMGFKVAETSAPAALNLDVVVTALKEGNQAARLIVGLGAGRAVLKFTATFSDSAGTPVGRFQGGDANTGTSHPFQNHNDMATWAASASVSQIDQFIRNEGAFPENKTKRAP